RGDSLERVWRTDVGTRANAFAKHMADRVRWQLEGWLSGTAAGPERAPLTSLAVIAEDVIPLGSEQAYLWGGVSGADDRARRALRQGAGRTLAARPRAAARMGSGGAAGATHRASVAGADP